MKFMRNILIAALLTPLALLQGCGSSDDSSATTTVSGSIVAAPVSGARVSVKNSAGKTIAGPVKTSASGSYRIAVPSSALSNDLCFEASGGTFTDEATGTAGVAAGRLAACVAGGTLKTTPTVHIDPASTIIEGLVSSGLTLSAAQTRFNNAFGFTPDPTIMPLNEAPAATPADNLPQRLAALRAAAFSQLTDELGLDPDQQFLLLDALTEDLQDGVLDGMNGASGVDIDATTPLPEDVQGRFSQALLNFRKNSPQNLTGLTIDQLGSIPENATALTANYKLELEYPVGVTSATMGKTAFTLRLTNRSDETPASGKSLKLIPYMHMATKDHSSPVDTIVDNGDGTYSCTVYYLMTTMMSGISQGVWELQVQINGTETATFFPDVTMAMGTSLVKLYGTSADMVASMGVMPPAKRTYLLFKESVNAATQTFNLFLATRDDAMMMKFPAVSGNSTLTDSTGATWDVNPATSSVQISTDNVNYYGATDNGGGHWSASNAGLILTPGATVYVKVTINGEEKTDIAGTPGPGIFTLPMM